jgi:hypothetical protein
MGFSNDYANVPNWVSKPKGYQTGAIVKYQGNVFYANFSIARLIVTLLTHCISSTGGYLFTGCTQ